MATVSVRVDDQVKAEAEMAADAIGMPLSTAVNIFLKKFANERGFPFNVNASTQFNNSQFTFDQDLLEKRMKAAVLNASVENSISPSDHFTYMDPITKKINSV